MKIAYDHVEHLMLKCEGYDDFLKKVNERSKEICAYRVEIKEMHYQTVAFLYTKKLGKEI